MEGKQVIESGSVQARQESNNQNTQQMPHHQGAAGTVQGTQAMSQGPFRIFHMQRIQQPMFQQRYIQIQRIQPMLQQRYIQIQRIQPILQPRSLQIQNPIQTVPVPVRSTQGSVQSTQQGSIIQILQIRPQHAPFLTQSTQQRNVQPIMPRQGTQPIIRPSCSSSDSDPFISPASTTTTTNLATSPPLLDQGSVQIRPPQMPPPKNTRIRRRGRVQIHQVGYQQRNVQNIVRSAQPLIRESTQQMLQQKYVGSAPPLIRQRTQQVFQQEPVGSAPPLILEATQQMVQQGPVKSATPLIRQGTQRMVQQEPLGIAPPLIRETTQQMLQQEPVGARPTPQSPARCLIIKDVLFAIQFNASRGIRVIVNEKSCHNNGVYVFDVCVLEKEPSDYPPVRLQVTEDYPAELPVFLDFQSIIQSIKNKKTRPKFELSVNEFKRRFQILHDSQIRIFNLISFWSAALTETSNPPKSLCNAKSLKKKKKEPAVKKEHVENFESDAN